MVLDSTNPIIEVKDVSFRYDLRNSAETLSSINFSVQKGEWVAIIGNNGSGKSTLAGILLGLYKPQFGSVTIAGYELNEETKWEIRKRMGIVFQNPDNQFIGSTVEDDVAFGLENLNMPYEQMKMRVYEALHMVDMDDYRHADPTRLSGGQKQRVAIAGLLALQPEILLLDEAFVMLDPKSRKDLLKTLQKLKSRHQLTIISITHDMNEAASSDRIIVLKNGTISSIGTPKEVFSKELDFEAPFTEKLRRILQMNGRNVPNTYMSEEEMVEWLWK
ncbi:energy-coupling factor transporter ATPase [Caldibacillus thermoamylovorans]|uniref:ABC transporter domain-containing protein n=1 Tax=Caldibacillus thermoamylovorans TaxID=35841 RepID=A0ABD4A5P2_9BACI|nr:energy-coupling factor transporter ATPase [Caldibacillus thermoamylovorans]KIO62747.1 hypothetical protein B4166_3115 [Caldibacillus thermoamylovorans]KIO72164.1 hypothetical protein B4167_3015 [Caldibacillus thermoamylovorans]